MIHRHSIEIAWDALTALNSQHDSKSATRTLSIFVFCWFSTKYSPVLNKWNMNFVLELSSKWCGREWASSHVVRKLVQHGITEWGYAQSWTRKMIVNFVYRSPSSSTAPLQRSHSRALLRTRYSVHFDGSKGSNNLLACDVMNFGLTEHVRQTTECHCHRMFTKKMRKCRVLLCQCNLRYLWSSWGVRKMGNEEIDMTRVGKNPKRNLLNFMEARNIS